MLTALQVMGVPIGILDRGRVELKEYGHGDLEAIYDRMHTYQERKKEPNSQLLLLFLLLKDFLACLKIKIDKEFS